MHAFIAAAVLSFLMITGAVSAAADVESYDVEVTYGQTDARSMLAMVNKFRTGSDAWEWAPGSTEKIVHTDLQPLTYDYELEKAAMKRAAEICLLFSHTRPDGSDCFTVGGFYSSDSIYGTACGENIAAGMSTAESAFTIWCEENCNYEGQGHRRNMLSSYYKTIGIGHACFNGTHFWVQEFGNKVHQGSTSPNNGKTVVKVDVESSAITEYALDSASVSKISVAFGGKKALPSVTGRISLELDGGRTWLGSAPVIVSPSWSSANTAMASVSGGYVSGKKVGSTSVRASWHGASLNVPVTVTPASLAAADVTAGSVTFTGVAKKPAATVVLKGKTLVKGTDYTTSWSGNVHAGTATVTVKGTGNYTGTASGSFTILPRSLKNAGFSVAPIPVQYYTGSAVKPAVNLAASDGSAAPTVQGTDYKVSCRNNVEVGTGSVTVTGIGDYKDTLTSTFKIQYRKAGTTMTVSGGVYKITKAGPTGTAEVSYVKTSGAPSSVSIPAKVTWDGVSYYVTGVASNAFKGNKTLTSVSIGSRAVTIGAYTFMGCPKLSTVVIGNGVKKIGAYAFKNCPKLKKVVIGTGVSTIGKHAFYNCKAVTAMTIRSTGIKQSLVAEDAFYGVGASAVVTVPASKLKVYKYIFKISGGSPKAVFKAAA